MTSLRGVRRFLAISFLLGVIAFVGRAPDNGDLYRKIGRDFAVLDCVDIHCFRILVPIVVEHLPGPSSLFKWKTYAVLTSAAAAMVTGRLCLVLGLSTRGAGFATWIAAFGYGPLVTIFDPYTADPAMYLLGPWLMADLLEQRLGRATIAASIGVFAKEFAAAPMWIYAGVAVLARQWELLARAALAALAVTTIWFGLQVVLMMIFNNTYGPNPSVDLLGGGYFRAWVAALGVRNAVFYLFSAFGPLYLLMAAGWRDAGPSMRRIAVASVPAAAAFLYVQQPDRALWNFHFVVIPIAVIALETLPDRLAWLFVAAYSAANLRLSEVQPAALVAFRVGMLGVSLVLAAYAAVRTSSSAAAPRMPQRHPVP